MIRPGDYIVYQNGDSFELGKVKRRADADDGWFVWYHEGFTAAMTPDRCIHELENKYIIRDDGFCSID